jgi:hypothetical protein
VANPHQHLCGWRGIDAVQKTFARQFPTLRQTAPHLFNAPPPNTAVLLYKAWTQVLGTDPHYPAQQIGDCVSFGHGHANDLLQCIQIGLGAPLQYEETDTEFIYAASRQVAGILGPTDGSYGSAAIKAMTSIGVLSRTMLGADGVYSGDRAKLWGNTGPPATYVAEAKSYKLGAGALVMSWDELVTAISNGYPVTICCDQGFTLARDAQGFVLPDEKWGHCMLIAGTRFDRPGACIMQSWGPDVPTGPTDLDQPSWSFWVDKTSIEAILAEGDSWALSNSPSFFTRGVPSSWKYSQAA